MSSAPADAELPGNDETQILRRLKRTPEIFQIIQQSAAEPLGLQRQLRSQFDDDLVRAALAVHTARQRAEGKLPEADKLWLTRVGLEQSTAWEVAQYKAKRFPADAAVSDLCCGIGVDSAALAGRGPVDAIDSEASMTLRCSWNAEVWGVGARVSARCEDVRSLEWTDGLVHVDPDRRCGRDHAARRLEQYQPDLEWMQTLCETGYGGALKLGPAANFMQKFPGCDVELISLNGECREATIWFGALARDEEFRATALPSGESLYGSPLMFRAPLTDKPQKYVYDPDPAVVRAGLVDALCERYGLSRLDDEEEYLTSEQLVQTALAVPFRVNHVLPNKLRQLKSTLRVRPSRHYEIKCRRISTNTSAMDRSLPRGDAPPATILVARCGGKARIIVGQRIG